MGVGEGAFGTASILSDPLGLRTFAAVLARGLKMRTTLRTGVRMVLVTLLVALLGATQGSGAWYTGGGRDTLQRVDTLMRVADSAAMADSLLGSDSLRMRDSAGVVDSVPNLPHPAIDSVQSAPPEAPKDSTVVLEGYTLNWLPVYDTLPALSRWLVEPITGIVRPVKVDSSLLYSYLYDPDCAPPEGRMHLGLSFSPSLRDDFARRAPGTDPLPYYVHAIRRQFPFAWGQEIYGTLGPFARIRLATNFSSTKEELYGQALITQNVTPGINLGVQLDHGQERSEYLNLESRVNALSFFGSYAKGRWFGHGGGGFSRYTLRDNGGMQDDKLLLDPTITPQRMTVKSLTAMESLRARMGYLHGEYTILRYSREIKDSTNTDSLLHYVVHAPLLGMYTHHEAFRYTRAFMETLLAAPGFSPRLSNQASADTLAQTGYSGTVGVWLRQLTHARAKLPSLRAGVGYQLDRYTMPYRGMYLSGRLGRSQHQLFFEAGTDYTLSKLRVDGYARIYLLGPQRGNLRVDGLAEYYPFGRSKGYGLHGEFRFATSSPHPFMARYLGNRYAWDKDLGRTVYTLLKASFVTPWWGEYGVQNVSYGNYIYLARAEGAVTPRQLDALNVLGVFVEQGLDMWGVQARVRGLWQLPSAVEASVPMVSLWGTLGYEYVFDRIPLSIRLMVECYYRTEFEGAAYDTDLGAFCYEAGRPVGNYPWLGAYLGLKWKTANIFARYMHMAQGSLGRNYLASPGYPERDDAFRFGIEWFFY